MKVERIASADEIIRAEVLRFVTDRRENPLTHKRKSRGFGSHLLHQVILAIAAAGDFGLTADEVSEVLRIGHESISARVNELANSGAIQMKPGVQRRTRQGGLASVYVVVRGSNEL